MLSYSYVTVKLWFGLVIVNYNYAGNCWVTVELKQDLIYIRLISCDSENKVNIE